MKAMLRTLLAMSALGAGCAAWTVKTETGHDADLARYQTYEWTGPTGGTSDALVDQRVRDQVAAELAQKGIHEAAPGQRADFLVAYRVESTPRLQTVVNAPAGYAPGASGAVVTPALPAMTYSYQDQALVLDFLDARSGRVFWRGYASYPLDRPAPASTAKTQKAVAKVLRRYPAG